MSNRSTMSSSSATSNHMPKTRTTRNETKKTLAACRAVRPIAAAVLLLGVSLPSVASASEEFPTELRAAANLSCTPTCSVCHEQDPGSQGTASKEFAVAMSHPELLDDRLVAGKPETVATAYDRLDPDGDRIVVFTNGAGEQVELNLLEAPCQAEVDYGCSVESKPKPAGSAGWWTPLLLSALGLGIYARRRVAR